MKPSPKQRGNARRLHQQAPSPRPGITSTILGASRVEQLRDNLASLELMLTPAQLDALNTGSAPEASMSDYFKMDLSGMAFGAKVQGWR